MKSLNLKSSRAESVQHAGHACPVEGRRKHGNHSGTLRNSGPVQNFLPKEKKQGFVHPLLEQRDRARMMAPPPTQVTYNRKIAEQSPGLFDRLKILTGRSDRVSRLGVVQALATLDFKTWSAQHPSDDTGRLFITRARHHLDDLRSLYSSEEYVVAFLERGTDSTYRHADLLVNIRSQQEIIESWMAYVVSETDKALFADFKDELAEIQSEAPSQRVAAFAQLRSAVDGHIFLSQHSKAMLAKRLTRALEDASVS